MRIGQGYDVHRLTEGRRLIIGGVDIPHEKGLLGHSDADVLTHAVMDAILGALCKGDIGTHFPDTDNNFKDADSLKLLEKVVEIMESEGYKMSNLDCTIIAQRPKMKPYIPEMLNNYISILKCENINIKATTEEKLGFTGSELGISASAVCLLAKK